MPKEMQNDLQVAAASLRNFSNVCWETGIEICDVTVTMAKLLEVDTNVLNTRQRKP